jgi:thiol-disulfide isomerase/thioredoxin
MIRTVIVSWMLLLVLGAGCGKSESPRAAEAPAAPPPVPAAPANAGPKTIRFIDDDYEAARAQAIARGVPLFVDVWASWCHTCLSMKQYVLPDPALAELADDFVWLAIDSERAQNRPFLERFATRSLPTLWVIDPRAQSPLLKWIGAATAGELIGVLEELRSLAPGTQADAPTASTPALAEAMALYLRGNRASALGQAEEAIGFYQRAITSASGSVGWSARTRALEALSMRLAELDLHAETVALAAREVASMPAGTSRLNVLVNALDASSDLPAEAPERAMLPALIELAARVAADATPAVLADDRSNLYASLVAALKEREPERARTLAQAWAGMLESHAERAPSAAGRRVFDPHRVDAYLALGEPARVLPMLEQSEREVPDDYNPPARLARAYLALQRYSEATSAIDRALARCEGPRKLRLFMLKADILVTSADRRGARAALEEALDYARAQQLPPQYDKLRQNIERRARELS